MYLDFIKDIAKVGSTVRLECANETFYGNIVRLSSDMIAIKKDNGTIIVKADSDISGLQILETPDSSKETVIQSNQLSIIDNSNDTKEDEEINEIDDIIRKLDLVLSIEKVKLQSLITTNATVETIMATGVSVITDDEKKLSCNKGFMAGFNKQNCIPGKRVFCVNANNKNQCYSSVLEMSYESLRALFIRSLNTKPIPRVPVAMSICQYLKVWSTNITAKKISTEIRAAVRELANEYFGDNHPGISAITTHFD